MIEDMTVRRVILTPTTRFEVQIMRKSFMSGRHSTISTYIVTHRQYHTIATETLNIKSKGFIKNEAYWDGFNYKLKVELWGGYFDDCH